MFKLASLMCATTVLGTAVALAAPLTSGRPTAVLDDELCQAVWNAQVKKGEVLVKDNEPYIIKDHASRYVINFSQVDGNGDNRISADEFKFACSKGMIEPYPTQ